MAQTSWEQRRSWKTQLQKWTIGQLRELHCMMTSSGLLTHPHLHITTVLWKASSGWSEQCWYLCGINRPELITVVCEAEAISNDQRITKVSEDHNDMEPLTPNHLQFFHPKLVWPYGSVGKKKIKTGSIHFRFILKKIVQRIPSYIKGKTKVQQNRA